MPLTVNIGHITGTANVKSLFPQKTSGERRSIPQMFFAPYESPREFFYCASHTVLPPVIAASAVVSPIYFGAVYGFFAGLVGISGIVAGVVKLFGGSEVSSFCTELFIEFMCSFVSNILQTLLDLVLLPISLLMLLTRSVSTGLHAVGICKGSEVAKEEAAEPSSAIKTTNTPESTLPVQEAIATTPAV